ncbi:MAG TPA: hypothetical protein VNO30_16170 [Kofleriaceae bacterium]|nr:hypothetical protein [Kofleriaceae bacterium]
MTRTRCLSLVAVAALAGIAHGTAHANDVFDVCKGESKTVVAGTGKMSIAVVYPDDFPVKTTPVMRNAVGARIANTESAKIVPAKDVELAKKLVDNKQWKEGGDACGLGPSLIAVLGTAHPNLSTAHASVVCEGSACKLQVDLERHGRPSAERWVRYTAPLAGAKDKVETITAAAPKLAAMKDAPIDRKSPGMAVAELKSGVVTVRSDVDGALEADRAMESSSAFAACRPGARKGHDIRGYWAEWKLSARGNPFQALVKPFAGRDPSDQAVAECLRKALEATQLACPRDAKVIAVKTAICL